MRAGMVMLDVAAGVVLGWSCSCCGAAVMVLVCCWGGAAWVLLTCWCWGGADELVLG